MEDIIICRCEEVTENEIKEAVADGAHSVSGVKRRTSAGMGLCQGRSCRRLVAAIIAGETGIAVSEIEPATVRPPVRPVTVKGLISGNQI